MKNRLKSLVLAASMAGLMAVSLPADGLADARGEVVKELSNHFASVPTMTGEFIQFGPNGEQTGGQFFIQRPGKLRFNYEDPSPLMLVSNGETIGVRNKKLKTWQYMPLDKNPLSILLADQISLDNQSIRSVETNPDVTRVVMGDKSIFGESEITLLFDPQSYDLRQWTIKDNQGKETSVMIFNVQKNVAISQKMFELRKKRPKNQSR
jgi:outer membrane lipoprotein-sorting protein